MSFAVTAVSKKLALAGVPHIITEGGHIVVETPQEAVAYNAKHMVPDVTKVVKQGKKWIYTRSRKKMVTEREYYAKLMRLKRAEGYGTQEKKLAKKREGKTPNPNRSKAIKKAWTSAPGLKAKHKAAVDAKKVKKTSKPAAKKVAKPAPKKSAKKSRV